MKRLCGMAVLAWAVLFCSHSVAEAGRSLQQPVIAGVTVGSGTVDVTWEDGNNPKTGFDIERREPGTGFSPVASVSKSQTAYSDDTVAAGGTYSYRIRTYYEKSGTEQWSIYSDESQAVTIPSVGCASDADCDDGLFCNGVEVCDFQAGCISSGNPCGSGETCSESANSCSAPAACGNGTVETGEQCDDGNTASGDCCSENCLFESQGASCDDGLFCNGIEVCDGSGACVAGAPPVCNDDVGCTSATCDESADSCVFTANDAFCDDGLFCTGAEVCDPQAGCVSPGDPCGSGETCSESTDSCDVPAVCGNGIVETWEQCDDGNTVSGDGCDHDCIATTGPLSPNSLSAAGVLATRVDVTWSDNSDNEQGFDIWRYHVSVGWQSIVKTGAEVSSYRDVSVAPDSAYRYAVRAFNVAGNSGWSNILDVSTPAGAALCGNGIVETGEQCDDGNTVSGDCCSPVCLFEVQGASCEDGLFCNGAEACDGSGTCTAGAPPACDDGVGCTSDSCDEISDSCVFTANDGFCDDGLFCTGTEICDLQAGCASSGDPCGSGETCSELTDSCDVPAVCGNGTVEAGEQCDDGNAVSGDCCSPVCLFEVQGASCGDGLFCNGSEVCDGSGACVSGAPPACDDGVSCTSDSCDETSDSCIFTANDSICGDGLFCTGAEVCDPQAGCVSSGDPCGSGETCVESTDSCDLPQGAACGNGTVEAGEQCDDGNALSGDGCDADCTATTAKPVAPGSLAAADVSATQVAVSWSDNSDNEQGFDIWRYHSSVGWSSIVNTGAGVTSYSDAGLDPATAYRYAVRAYNVVGTSSWSNIIDVTTDSDGSADTTPPTVPGSLAAAPDSCTAIALTWTSSSDSGSGVRGYKVYRDGVNVTEVPHPATSYTDSGLSESAACSYYVVAYDNADNPSSQSNLAATSTPSCSSCGDGVVDAGEECDDGNQVSGDGCESDCTVTPSSGGGGELRWSRAFGGPDSFDVVYGHHVAVDPGTSEMVVTGKFSESAHFGGGVVTAAGGEDVFLAKYSAGGAYRWSRAFGGPEDEEASSVAISASGDIIVTGWFSGSVNFGGATLTSAGGDDIFVAAYDSGGSHLWSRAFGSGTNDHAYAVAVDNGGNILVTGYFTGSVDFGDGVLTANGSDVFVAKFGADGTSLWSRQAGGVSSDTSTAIAVDGSGSVVITGYFYGNIDFGGTLFTSGGSYDVFAAKYYAGGGLAWAKSFGNGSSDQGSAVAVDIDGSVILSGSFFGTIDLGGGTLVDNGYGDIFMAKFSSGGQHLWSKSFGSSWQKADLVGAVAVNHANGEIVMTGSVLGNMDFGGQTLISDGDYDAFLAKFTSGGVHLWSKRAGGVGYDSRGRGVAIDPGGNVVATGFFDDETDFGGELLVNDGGYDLFLHKFWP